MSDGIAAMNGSLRKPVYTLDQKSERLVLLKGAGGIELDTPALYEAVTAALRGGQKELRFDKLQHELGAPSFEQIWQEVAIEPQNAGYSESFEVIPEVVGVSFDPAQALELWKAAGIGEQVIVPLTITQPDYTAEQLKALLFRDLLGAQMTYYSGSTAERVNNIRLAAGKLDGMILLPGESFSYNEAVGKRTEEAGFQYADAYSDGQVVPELGGGICQVSSTLYSAALYSRLKILSRTNHYFKVGYLDYGMDATVSWGGPDYRFKNTRDYPVKLNVYYDDHSVTIEFWGTNVDGSHVSPWTTSNEVYDEQWGCLIGYSVTVIRNILDADDNLITQIQEPTGIYHLHDHEIDWPEEKLRQDAAAQ
jgi:vancomycin resistance protein YoaR